MAVGRHQARAVGWIDHAARNDNARARVFRGAGNRRFDGLLPIGAGAAYGAHRSLRDRNLGADASRREVGRIQDGAAVGRDGTRVRDIGVQA